MKTFRGWINSSIIKNTFLYLVSLGLLFSFTWFTWEPVQHSDHILQFGYVFKFKLWNETTKILKEPGSHGNLVVLRPSLCGCDYDWVTCRG